MKTITFPVTPPTERQLEYATYSLDNNKGNGLFSLLYKGYSAHIPVTIRPDDILNNVISIWSKYVFLNSEKFREQFVEHEGKKALVYHSGGSYSDGRMQEFMDGLINLIEEDQADDKALWAADVNFNTTTDTDLFVRSTATLAAQKDYYEYGVCLACGFSSITLEGTETDWDALKCLIEAMPTLEDTGLVGWKERLSDVVSKIVSDESEDFWQTGITEQRYGSGGQSTKSGWAVVFNPINEGGHWINSIEDKDVLDLSTDFDLNVDDNGNEFTVNIKAGPVNVKFEDGSLSVENVSTIEEKVTA